MEYILKKVGIVLGGLTLLFIGIIGFNTMFPVASENEIEVIVIGEVENPGIYDLIEGETAADAILGYAGATSRSDLSEFDLTVAPKDGDIYNVPVKVVQNTASNSGGYDDSGTSVSYRDYHNYNRYFDDNREFENVIVKDTDELCKEWTHTYDDGYRIDVNNPDEVHLLYVYAPSIYDNLVEYIKGGGRINSVCDMYHFGDEVPLRDFVRFVDVVFIVPEGSESEEDLDGEIIEVPVNEEEHEEIEEEIDEVPVDEEIVDEVPIDEETAEEGEENYELMQPIVEIENQNKDD